MILDISGKKNGHFHGPESVFLAILAKIGQKPLNSVNLAEKGGFGILFGTEEGSGMPENGGI